MEPEGAWWACVGERSMEGDIADEGTSPEGSPDFTCWESVRHPVKAMIRDSAKASFILRRIDFKWVFIFLPCMIWGILYSNEHLEAPLTSPFRCENTFKVQGFSGYVFEWGSIFISRG
jgi:hypothetical protein